MLTQLVIQNYTIVDSLELELANGMTVITGETGAGKSIMLDALSLALGDRAESGLISDGKQKAEIIASFDISEIPEAIAWLQSRDLMREGDVSSDELILRRTLNREGRSRAYINSSPVNLQDLAAIGDLLIDIHAQHEHQSLLKRESHRQLLDNFGGMKKQGETVRQLFRDYRACNEKLQQLIHSMETTQSQQQLMQYQLQELTELAPAENEYDGLVTEQKRLANADELINLHQQALDLLVDTDTAVTDQLGSLVQKLKLADDADLNGIAQQLEASQIQLEEAARDLRHHGERIEVDPHRLSQVEARLNDMFSLARKHRVEPNLLPELMEKLQLELGGMEQADQQIDSLKKDLSLHLSSYQAAAKKLSKARLKTADKLSSRVNTQLQGLGMPDAELKVLVDPNPDKSPTEYGYDMVELLIRTVEGQQHRPLNRIASGGELSRISLAIQVVTADTSRTPTLVFDEVDVGIGGAVAEVVGHLLQELGNKSQVLCVTHLPQVAAQGHQHLRVSKTGKPTRTVLDELCTQDRVVEVARMLGGVELTDQSLAHAEKMLGLSPAS